MNTVKWPFAAALLLAGSLGAGPAHAADTIVSEWDSVRAPPAPALHPVTVDPKTTALLVIDLEQQTCNQQRRPRCVTSLPVIHDLVTRARTAGMLVVYTMVVGSNAADIRPEAAPVAGEATVTAPLDKFLGTNLDAVLHAAGVKTVIVTGVAVQGAVLITTVESVLHGYEVVYPVDGVSGEAYAEQYGAWQLTNGPGVTGHVTLTTAGQIHF